MDSTNKVFKFQSNEMIVHAKGPNVNKNINMSSSFRTNLMSSTMNMPRNFEKQNYAESLASQRSLYYRRDTSPTASIRSEFQPRNFYQSFYQGGSSLRSTYNGRGGSPVSMRSIDSSTSVDIIRLIKNANFNDHEWRSIRLAINKKTKHNLFLSKKAKRRQKIKHYYKTMRSCSGDDSGEQGSNSSLSSDDCASTRTGYSTAHTYNRNYKENVPQSTTGSDLISRNMFNRQDTMENNIGACGGPDMQNPYNRGTNLYQPKKIHQNGIQNNMADLLSSKKNCANVSVSQRHTLRGAKNMLASQRSHIGYGKVSSTLNALNASMCSTKSLQNTTLTSQKERFQSGFQFPLQRFNNSNIPFQDCEKGIVIQNVNQVSVSNYSNKVTGDDSNENDNIFFDIATKPQPVPNKNGSIQKRNIESLGSVPTSASKKCKKSDIEKEKHNKQTNNDNVEKKDFEFAKPQFPIRKFVYTKPCEEIISKSAAPFGDFAVSEQQKNILCEPAVEPCQDKETELEVSETTQLTSNDLSMRPSFIKRKLFTQTLDVTERKNMSSESLAIDSPQSNIYSALAREKHRTRKLVTSQSLLSRDINQDDNNLLDLIHKIVPPSQVKNTNAVKSSKITENKTTENGDDKWDITSIITTCNDDGVSDTYTDDEIFKAPQGDKGNKIMERSNKKLSKINEKNSNLKFESTKGQNIIVKKCNVVVSKLAITPEVSEIKTATNTYPIQKPVPSNSRIDAFWNTDVESDYESAGTPKVIKTKKRQGTQDITTPKLSNIEVRPNASFKKPSNTRKLSPLVVYKKDPTLIKTLKKQTNKQILTKPDKTLKKSNNKISQLDKSDRTTKPSPATVLKTRRQTNLSTVAGTVEKTRSEKKVSITSKTIRRGEQHSEQNKNEEVTKTQIQSQQPMTQRNKKQNNSNQQADDTKTQSQEENHKTRRQPKHTKGQNNAVSPKTNMFCKVLRSRFIDLSSSFNSDQFDLTGISHVRKSRTPKISLKKSKNAFVDVNRKESKHKRQR